MAASNALVILDKLAQSYRANGYSIITIVLSEIANTFLKYAFVYYYKSC